MTRLHGAQLDPPLSHTACGKLLDAIVARDPSADAPGPWLLAHTDHGVIWGHRPGGTGAWRFAGDAFPGDTSPLDPATVQQVRVFGPDTEVLLWRAGGRLHGRRLADGSGIDPAGPAQPYREPRVLLADRVLGGPRDGFTLVGDAAGSRQVVPLACDPGWFNQGRWPLRLILRHYLEADEDTGMLRVAATRLVTLTHEER